MVIYMTTPILPHNHGDIHNVLEAMPSKDTCADMASAFKQLCDGTRLQIFWLLCHSEECVLNISAAVGMSAPAVSHHLRCLKDAGLIILAVKPQVVDAAITAELAAAMPPQATVLSIMGSVDLAKLHQVVPGHAVIRVMPNTPLAVGAGMTAIAPDSKVSSEMIDAAKTIFGSCGEVEVVAESAIEAITAVSGCGPGYVFMLIDALADAGVNAGLPRALAIKLAAQTFAGSGKMVLETALHPAQLRDQVTSPGGTTIAGIHALENRGVRAAMYDAVLAVLERSEKLKGK